MVGCLSGLSWEGVAQFSEIITPIVGIVWFLYAHYDKFKGAYFSELKNIYAGYTDPIIQAPKGYTAYAGVILSIKEVNQEGFFLGEFDFAESVDRENKTDGLFSFYGKIKYRYSVRRDVHPLKPDTNKVYLGKFYVVDSLETHYKDTAIDNYISYEYDILHYREMGLIKLKLVKKVKPDAPDLPTEMNLLKSKGLALEPYKTLKRVVFMRYTLSDADRRDVNDHR